MSGAVYAYIEDRGYIYRKNDNSISYRYKPESMKCWLTIAGTLQKIWHRLYKKREVYEGFIRYLIFFAAFFDAEMDYTAYHHSKKAEKMPESFNSTHPLAAKCFKELTDRRKTGTLSSGSGAGCSGDFLLECSIICMDY